MGVNRVVIKAHIEAADVEHLLRHRLPYCDADQFVVTGRDDEYRHGQEIWFNPMSGRLHPSFELLTGIELPWLCVADEETAAHTRGRWIFGDAAPLIAPPEGATVAQCRAATVTAPPRGNDARRDPGARRWMTPQGAIRLLDRLPAAFTRGASLSGTDWETYQKEWSKRLSSVLPTLDADDVILSALTLYRLVRHTAERGFRTALVP